MTGTDSTSLLGKRVVVSISDPWDFVTDNGGARNGVIMHDTRLSDGTFAIKLDVPVKERETLADILFAGGRQSGSPSATLRAALSFPAIFPTKATCRGGRGPSP